MREYKKTWNIIFYYILILNYLKFLNMRVQKKKEFNIEKIAFKVVQWSS